MRRCARGPVSASTATEADEFHGDYLVERCPIETYADEGQESTAPPGLGGEQPISMFARQVRARRRLDTAWTLAWMLIGLLARAPLLARIEGALDHDQSIVGLMALDIAAGERWPVFFDGQRYMGAVEPYTAAALVRLFGHSPVVVALAPWLFFGLFAAGQFVLWRTWSDRATGHLAALLTVVCAPMLALWSIVPRGGYIEVVAWALPVLGIYRRMIRPGDAPPLPWRRCGRGRAPPRCHG